MKSFNLEQLLANRSANLISTDFYDKAETKTSRDSIKDRVFGWGVGDYDVFGGDGVNNAIF
jgi:hypothetical protein